MYFSRQANECHLQDTRKDKISIYKQEVDYTIRCLQGTQSKFETL